MTFDEAMQNPPGDVDPDDVTNPANYLLVAPGRRLRLPDHRLRRRGGRRRRDRGHRGRPTTAARDTATLDARGGAAVGAGPPLRLRHAHRRRRQRARRRRRHDRRRRLPPRVPLRSGQRLRQRPLRLRRRALERRRSEPGGDRPGPAPTTPTTPTTRGPCTSPTWRPASTPRSASGSATTFRRTRSSTSRRGSGCEAAPGDFIGFVAALRVLQRRGLQRQSRRPDGGARAAGHRRRLAHARRAARPARRRGRGALRLQLRDPDRGELRRLARCHPLRGTGATLLGRLRVRRHRRPGRRPCLERREGRSAASTEPRDGSWRVRESKGRTI